MSHITLRIAQLRAFNAEYLKGQSLGRFSRSYMLMIYLTFLKKHLHLFADDINIFIQGDNLPQLNHDLQTKLTTLADWLNMNKLTMNLAKMYIMIFH